MFTALAAFLTLATTPAVSASHEDQAPWLVCLLHPTCDPDTNPAVGPTVAYANAMADTARCIAKYPFTCDPSLLGATLHYVDELL